MFKRFFCVHDYKQAYKANFTSQRDGSEYSFIFCECKRCKKHKVFSNYSDFLTPSYLKNIITDWERKRITTESLEEILG